MCAPMTGVNAVVSVSSQVNRSWMRSSKAAASSGTAACITITRVEVTNDLGLAKIHYSILGSPGEKSRARHMLADATGFVRRQLGRVLNTRRVPELAWYYDDSQEFQEEMENKIQAALDRDLAVNPSAHTGDVPTPTKDEGAEQEGEQSVETQEDEEGLS